ncbi:MAG: acyl-ACP--UDP-N-acetylglucosamine O-acyltransferase [Verrucomicrobiales bacterium]
MPIHPTALISPDARLAPDVEVGAYAIIEGAAEFGPGSVIGAHAQVLGRVIAGPRTQIGRAAIIGGDPQDLSFDPATGSGVRLGEGNVIREHCTIHRSTLPGGFTQVGDGNFLMAGVHLGHDVRLGSRNVIANACLLAGHVEVGDRAFLGGGSVFHQFLRIGSFAMVQGNSSMSQDVPPYCIASQLNQLCGLNAIGLRRAGFTAEERDEIRALYRLLFRSGKLLGAAVGEAARAGWCPRAQALLDFVAAPSKKGICVRG